MNFEELEKLSIMLYGEHWISDLANDLEIRRNNISVWKFLGVPDWVFHEMASVVNKRAKEIDEAVKFFNGMGER